MVVGVGGMPADAGRWGAGRARGARRRDVLRGLLGAGAVLAVAPVVAASRPPGPGDTGDSRDTGGSGENGFVETYRGRHIVGIPIATERAEEAVRWQVTVDGHPLHLMRRADGTWLSMVDHYRSYATPLEAARAAVDELGPGEQLRDPDAARSPHDHMHLGGHDGLHP